MIGQLSKMKIFNEFVEWILPIYRMSKGRFIEAPPSLRVITDRELHSLLVEFCDSKGYYITVQKDYTANAKEEILLDDWDYYIVGENLYREAFDFDTRTEATQAAIIKCFELMEKEI